MHSFTLDVVVPIGHLLMEQKSMIDTSAIGHLSLSLRASPQTLPALVKQLDCVGDGLKKL